MQVRLELSAKLKERLIGAVRSFPAFRVLVAGDVMLDHFIWGDVRRISPEAPVPVVEVQEETFRPGGSANVVGNAASLGAKVLVTGILGDDVPGRELSRLLAESDIPTEGLIVDENRPTTVKTRVVAGSQQVVRFDRERTEPLSKVHSQQIFSFIEEHIKHVHAVVISDYAKGVVTRELMDSLRSLAASTAVPIVVDPKAPHVSLYHGVSLITPNRDEAARMSGIDIKDEADLANAGARLLNRLGCDAVLITRGKDGMTLFRPKGKTDHIPTVARRVFDVTGAGDTVTAAISLGISAGLSTVEAALLANFAAGIVVGEVGTATVSAGRLISAIDGAAHIP